MGFRFYRRIGGQSGLGINISKTGASASVRTAFGSIGQRGFSIRTPLKGLSFRGSWGKTKNKDLANFISLFFLALFLTIFVISLVYNIIRFIIWLIAKIYYLINSLRNKQSIIQETN